VTSTGPGDETGHLRASLRSSLHSFIHCPYAFDFLLLSLSLCYTIPLLCLLASRLQTTPSGLSFLAGRSPPPPPAVARCPEIHHHPSRDTWILARISQPTYLFNLVPAQQAHPQLCGFSTPAVIASSNQKHRSSES